MTLFRRNRETKEARAALQFVELYRNADVDANGISFEQVVNQAVAANTTTTVLVNFESGESARFAPFERFSVANNTQAGIVTADVNGVHSFPVPQNAVLNPPFNPSVRFVNIKLNNNTGNSVTFDVSVAVYREPIDTAKVLQRNVRYP